MWDYGDCFISPFYRLINKKENILSIIECDYKEGNLVMANYEEVVCFTGAHLFHSIIGITTGCIFVIICLTVCSCFFEIRIKSENIMAR